MLTRTLDAADQQAARTSPNGSRIKIESVPNVTVNGVLNLLLCSSFEAMTISASRWPVLSEDVQERCLKRVSGRTRLIEGLSPQLQTQAIAEAVGERPEQQLLPYFRFLEVQGE